MKVLHLININTYGGAEKLLISFLPAMKRGGIDSSCAILCPNGSNQAALEIRASLESNGIPVFYHEYDSVWSRKNFSWVRTTVRQSGCELVHCHLRYADIWMSVLKVWGMVKQPFVSTVHGYNDDYMNRHGLRIVRSAFITPYYWITRFVSRRAKGLIFISQCMKEFYGKASFTGNTKTTVIYHGYPEVRQVDNEPKPGVIQDPQIVLPGRIVERKGHLYALDALKNVLKNFPAARLHLLGKGPFEEALKQKVNAEKLEDQVIFHGYKNNIVEELRRYDIVLVPSYWEPFGLVFLDGFAAGVPVTGFDLPAGNEIIRDKENGLLAIPYDSGSLAEKINLLCRQPELRSLLVKNASRDLQQRFSLERMVGEYQSFYKQMITPRKNIKQQHG